MEGRFGDIVLTARYFYVTALVHLTKDFDDLIYSVSFLFHVSGRVLARQSLIFNGPVCGGQVSQTLYQCHQLRYAILGNRLYQKMHVVFITAYLKKLQFVALLYLKTHVPNLLIDYPIQHRPAVLSRKHQMVQ